MSIKTSSLKSNLEEKYKIKHKTKISTCRPRLVFVRSSPELNATASRLEVWIERV